MSTKGSTKKKSTRSAKKEAPPNGTVIARTITELPEFTRWLNQQCGEGKPALGFTILWLGTPPEWEIAFANGTEVYCAYVSETTKKIISLPLQNALCSPKGVKLVVNDIGFTLEKVQEFLGPKADMESLVNNIQEEFRALAYSCGDTSVGMTWEAPVVLKRVQELAQNCPALYKSVTLPYIKLQVLHYSGPAPEGTPVTVSYTNLLLRLLAYLSGDPTLLRVFSQDPNPDAIGILKEKLDLPREKVLQLLTATAFGGYNEIVQKVLPVYYWWATEEITQLAPDLHTLYGRHNTPIAEGEDALSKKAHHLIFGSLEDLVQVAVVSLANVGVKYLSVHEWPVAEKAIITGIIPAIPGEPIEQDIRQVVDLAHPFGNPILGGVPLGATVIVG